jgi:hypothetical protein
MNLRKSFIFFMIVLLMVPTIWTSKTEASTLSSPNIGELYDWILDDQAGYIYAINMSNEVLFLNKTSMKMEAKIQFTSDIITTELSSGKLYVSTKTDLRVVDLATRKVVKTYQYAGLKEMAIDENRLYFITEVRYSPIYMLDLQTGKAVTLKITDSTNRELFALQPTIAIDAKKDILYVADSDSSGSEAVAVRLSDHKIIDETNYNNGRGFSYPSAFLQFDNGELFFAGFKLDGSHLHTIHGQYKLLSSYNNPVINVFKNYVVTSDGVFNRNTFEYVVDVPGESVLIDNQNYLYLYTDNNVVVKNHINNFIDTDPTYYSEDGTVEFSYPITDLITDHKSGYIFAVSEEGNRLYYIRMNDMTVQHEIMIGSRPVDVNVMDGKVYVALYGATKIAVTNVLYDGKIQQIIIDQNPYQLEAFNNKLVFANNDQFNPVMMYDLSTKVSTDISASIVSNPNMSTSIHSPDLTYDKETNRLFVSETGVSGAKLLAVDGTSLAHLERDNFDNGYGFPNPEHNKLFVQNGEVFIHRFILDANDITQEKGAIPFTNMSEENVVGVSKEYIFSPLSVYSRSSLKKLVDFPYKMSAVKEVKETGELFVYSNEYQILTKYTSADDVLADLILFGDDKAPEPTKEFLSYQAMDVGHSFAAEDIYDFMQADLVKGYVKSDGTVHVKPNDTITRAQFVAILVRALGLKDIPGGKEFQDVKSSAWYYPYIQKATAYGIVDGVSATQFAPGRNIRRDEIAKLVVRAFEKSVQFAGTSKTFTDVPKNHWSKQYIDKASSVGIIHGLTNTTFGPTQNATRAQAIVMLSRGFKLENSDLPSNEHLEQTVLTFENTLGELIGQQKFTEATNLIQKDTTGFYQHFNLYNIAVIKHHLQKGIAVDFKKNGDIKATVIKKKNHLAIVKLEGAEYIQTYTKGDFTYSIDQNTSGLLYLIKDETGKWKIYRFDIGAI